MCLFSVFAPVSSIYLDPSLRLPQSFNQSHLWAAQQRAVGDYVFPKPLISGQISCNFFYTEQPLIWLMLWALDEWEGIPVKCCNATALRERPSIATFNLFRGRKIFFLCEAALLDAPMMCVILIEPATRLLETGNGIKMWSESRPSQLNEGQSRWEGDGEVVFLSRSLWHLSLTPQLQQTRHGWHAQLVFMGLVARKWYLAAESTGTDWN